MIVSSEYRESPAPINTFPVSGKAIGCLSITGAVVDTGLGVGFGVATGAGVLAGALDGAAVTVAEDGCEGTVLSAPGLVIATTIARMIKTASIARPIKAPVVVLESLVFAAFCGAEFLDAALCLFAVFAAGVLMGWRAGLGGMRDTI